MGGHFGWLGQIIHSACLYKGQVVLLLLLLVLSLVLWFHNRVFPPNKIPIWQFYWKSSESLHSFEEPLKLSGATMESRVSLLQAQAPVAQDLEHFAVVPSK